MAQSPFPLPPDRDIPRLRHLLAPNPSPLTFHGTNTYLLGSGQVAVIDPGPEDDRHLAAILAALDPGERISHILVTHSHRDHSALAPRLSAATGAPVLAFGRATDGCSPLMSRLAAAGLTAGGDGLDTDFTPDARLSDGSTLHGPDWSLTALHTPGHLGNHLCFAVGGWLFSGDHVMGWSSSVISPPDGDMAAYCAALQRLQDEPWDRFLPGHGDPIPDPAERLHALLTHRHQRETQILALLSEAPTDPGSLTMRLYHDTPPALHPAARRNVLAHLLDLLEKNRVRTSDPTAPDAIFHLT